MQIWQRNLPVVVFLTSRIPKGKFDVLSIYFDVRYVVLEDGGNVNLEMKEVEVNITTVFHKRIQTNEKCMTRTSIYLVP